MIGRVITKIVVYLLRKSNISLNERHLLINASLDKLAALPLRDIITFSETGTLIVNGRELDHEEVLLVRESAKAALQNRALGLVRDQVLYKSFTFGINSSVNFDQLYFAKCAVWWGQEEDKILKALASL